MEKYSISTEINVIEREVNNEKAFFFPQRIQLFTII